jgi:hypothetical protein
MTNGGRATQEGGRFFAFLGNENVKRNIFETVDLN